MDEGNQSQDGPAATVAGTIANGPSPLPGVAPRPSVPIVRQVTHAVPVTADARGRLRLPVGIDSGFEGLTRIFLQRIVVQLTPVPTWAATVEPG